MEFNLNTETIVCVRAQWFFMICYLIHTYLLYANNMVGPLEASLNNLFPSPLQNEWIWTVRLHFMQFILHFASIFYMCYVCVCERVQNAYK